ncbi:MAG: 1-deoxy-D-xylulose-5-phosphate synthase [Candidatus Diapherotrites archaeon]
MGNGISKSNTAAPCPSIRDSYPLLEKINSPKDLQSLSMEELPRVADEVRDLLLETCAKNGGHIGTNLGVVELTLALHYVFDFSKDRLLFDTSHQSYTHKILTGRFKQFNTICTPKGIPRFTVRGENPYDCWSAGHASTALSGAMGMAEGRDQKKQRFDVVAVFGDGALTGGMCYEALNNIGYNQTDMLLVLNDNKMSISPNVGAMFEYLKRLSDVSVSERGRREIGTIFEKLGIRYYGPVDGHNIPELIRHLQELRQVKGPKLLHVLTDKAKGVEYMEKDKTKWHEHAAFELETGIPLTQLDPSKPKFPSIESIAINALIRAASTDKDIVAITAAMAAGTGLIEFGEKFPDRFYDVGIAEEHAVTFAAGLACEGVKPFAVIYSPFLQRAFDQAVADVAMMNLPVRFMVPKAAITGDGPTQGGILDISYLRLIPNFIVMAPKDENELQHMVTTAAHYNKGPISLRYPKGTLNAKTVLDKEPNALEIGKAEIVQEGKDISLIGIGFAMEEVLKAAKELGQKKYNVEVINARFAKPLDERTLLKSVRKTGRAITVEENAKIGGFGSAVLEMLQENNQCDIALKRIGGKDAFIGYDSPQNIKADWKMDASAIVENALEILKNK